MRWPSHCALDVVILTDAKTHQGGLGWGGCRQHHRLTTDSALWQHHRRPTTCLSSESPSDFISHRTTRRPPAPLPHSASLHSAEDRHHVLRSPSAHCTSSSAPSGSHRRPDLWKRDTYMRRARNRWSRPSASCWWTTLSRFNRGFASTFSVQTGSAFNTLETKAGGLSVAGQHKASSPQLTIARWSRKGSRLCNFATLRPSPSASSVSRTRSEAESVASTPPRGRRCVAARESRRR